MAANAGLAGLSITDHDTVDGLEEGSREARRLGLRFLNGVEMSVACCGQDFHLLGYDFDPTDPGLLSLLREAGEGRIRRAKRILNRLHSLGVDLPFEQVSRRSLRPAGIGRPHVAQALLEEGWVRSVPEAFARYLGSRAPAYVPKDPVDPPRALRVLRRAGGVAVLAHPASYRLHGAWDLFVREGLQGLETETGGRDAERAASLRRLADRFGLARTGGSDFHGSGISEIPVGGARVDIRVLDDLAARKG